MLERIKFEWNCLYRTNVGQQGKERKSYLDMAKGIAIFLVVLGHSGVISSSVNIWLSTFHLPTFFIVSGILMNLKQEEKSSFNSIIKKKIKGIMVPYLYFTMGTAVFIGINIFKGNLDGAVMKQLILQTITFQGYSVMWFLPVIFLAELFVLLLIKLFRRIFPGHRNLSLFLCVVTTLTALVSYHIYKKMMQAEMSTIIMDESRILGKAFIAAAFICYGYAAANLISWMEAKEGGRRGYVWAELFAGTVLSVINVAAASHIQVMDLNNLNVGALYLYFLLGIGGSLGVIFICRRIPTIPVLVYYGQNSLIIMCTHMNFYVLYIAQLISLYVAAYLPGDHTTIWGISSMILVMLLEIPVIIVIKVFLPFMLGKNICNSSAL